MPHESALADWPRLPMADLLGLQLSFNLFPAHYVHASWLSPLGLDATAPVADSPLWLRALSTALLRKRQLHRHFDCDFHDPAKRLALIDATTLTRIAGLMLATLLRERLRRVVQRPQVQVLRDCMGAEAHQFALHWQGAVPVIPWSFDDSEGWLGPDWWAQCSVAQLFAVIPPHAIGVLERMRMRFPAQWTLPDVQQRQLSDTQRSALVALILAIIATAAGQWSWLFRATEPSPSHPGDA